jgi:hypothetical protein
MKRNERTAFNALKKMGCPVFAPEGCDYGAFIISAEDNSTDLWADYYQFAYGEFGVKQEVCDLLRKNKLFCEWVNPGMLGVYQI